MYIVTLILDKNNDLHLPQVSLVMYQKGVYYSGFKTFKNLPKVIKDISSEPKRFKITLRQYLLNINFTV
jgi:hypothetical protein